MFFYTPHNLITFFFNFSSIIQLRYSFRWSSITFMKSYFLFLFWHILYFKVTKLIISILFCIYLVSVNNILTRLLYIIQFHFSSVNTYNKGTIDARVIVSIL